MLELEILGGLVSSKRNWGRWSEMVVVRFPDIDEYGDGEANMLSLSVLDWAVILVGSVMKGRIWQDPRRTRKLEEPQLELQFN